MHVCVTAGGDPESSARRSSRTRSGILLCGTLHRVRLHAASEGRGDASGGGGGERDGEGEMRALVLAHRYGRPLVHLSASAALCATCLRESVRTRACVQRYGLTYGARAVWVCWTRILFVYIGVECACLRCSWRACTGRAHL